MGHPVKVAEADLETFVTRLKLNIPASIKVHNVAVNVLSGRWPYSEFWVDCWPDFNGAIVVPKKDVLPSFQGVYLLSGTEKSAKLLLKHCVEWTPHLEIHGIHDDLYPTLVKAAKSHGVIERVCVDNDVFGVKDNQWNRPALMEGYTTKPLGHEHLPYIVEHWPFSHLFENPLEFIGTLSSCFPTLGVFDCHGDLAAHAGFYQYGSVAFLGVDEKHRRKGIGQFLLSEMISIGNQTDNIIHGTIAYLYPRIKRELLVYGLVLTNALQDEQIKQASIVRPVKVAGSDMEKFVARLKLDIPANIKVHNVAVNVLTGRWPYSEFWVDCWPDFHGAIVVPKKDALPTFQGVYLLCGTEMSVKLLLKHCVRWIPPIEFHGIPVDLYPALAEAANLHGVIETSCMPNDVFLVKDNQWNRHPLMEGYTTKPLGPEQLLCVAEHWPHSHIFENPLELFGTLTSCFPTLAVFDCHGDLAAYAGFYPYGPVAFLSVDEKHRRKGIGKFLLSEMLDIGRRTGIIPHSSINRGNDLALKLHIAVGLHPTEKCEMSVFYKSKYLNEFIK